MSESNEIPKIEGFISVKEAAEILKVSDKMIYFYVENKRLSAVRAANVLLIPIEAVENFQQQSVGRPRTKTPIWRIPTKDNVLLVISINVQILQGQEDNLMSKLQEFKQQNLYNFPGTVARYVISYETAVSNIEILLTWKSSLAPDEAVREQMFEDFRKGLIDVLDWSTAQYKYGKALMNT